MPVSKSIFEARGSLTLEYDMTASVSPPAAGGSQRKGPLLACILLMLTLAAMDSTVVVTLLPDVIDDIHIGSLYPWLASGFIVAGALVTPVVGKAADLLGAKRTMLAAATLFLATSAMVALAPNGAVLTSARVLQGVGAGALTVMAYVLAGSLFEEEERTRLQSSLTAVWGVSAIGGPVVGTLFVETIGWRWAFGMNIPLTLIAIVVIGFGLRTEPGERSDARLDWPAMGLFAFVLTALLMLLLAPNLPLGGVVFAAIAVAMAVGLWVQHRYVRRHPERSVIPLDVVRPGPIRVAALVTLGASITLHGSLTLLPLAAAELGLGRLAGGAAVTAGAIGLIAGSLGCARTMRRVGYRGSGLAAAVVMLAGAVLLVAGALGAAAVGLFLVGECLIGAACGVLLGMTLVLVQNTAAAATLGAHTSAVSLLRSGGGAVGVNILASAQLLTAQHIGGDATRSSFVVAFLVQFVVVALTALAALRLPPGGRGEKEREVAQDRDTKSTARRAKP